MKIKTFNTINLIPIGNVSFTFTKRKSTNTRTYIYVGEINILDETDRNISKETYKSLMKLMKQSDLLTDGHNFFTTRGEKITQIKHGGFDSFLNIHKKEVHELLYK